MEPETPEIPKEEETRERERCTAGIGHCLVCGRVVLYYIL